MLAARRKLHTNQAGGSAPQSQTSSPLERLFTLLLPFVFVFLLPTIKLSPESRTSSPKSPTGGEFAVTNLLETSRLFGTTTGGDLLLALIRLPFDKMRLQMGAGSLVLAAESKEIISSKSDLQEEETHMMLLAPAEHRSSYGGGGGGGPAQVNYNPYNQGGDSGPQAGEPHAQAMPAPGDYGGPADSADQQNGGGSGGGGNQAGGQGEATVSAEPASTGIGLHNEASSLQTRSDLPAVRALNVKCEKNHMTVSRRCARQPLCELAALSQAADSYERNKLTQTLFPFHWRRNTELRPPSG